MGSSMQEKGNIGVISADIGVISGVIIGVIKNCRYINFVLVSCIDLIFFVDRVSPFSNLDDFSNLG